MAKKYKKKNLISTLFFIVVLFFAFSLFLSFFSNTNSINSSSSNTSKDIPVQCVMLDYTLEF